MKLFLVSLLFLLLPILGLSTHALAAGSCTVCLDNVSDHDIAQHKAYACTQHHCIDRDCVARQVKALENVSELESKGLACCGDKCKERLSLETVKQMLDSKDRAELEARLTKASRPTDASLAKEDVQRLIRGIENAFVLCCPTDGCGSGLDQIEGCNAAKCSNEACKATFCYLCLEEQDNSQAAHAHVRDHSGNFWEQRPGYTDRYQWILSRKKLAQLFEHKVDKAVRSQALETRKALLKAKNMWPMPAGLMSQPWIEAVRDTHLPHDKMVEILQNEYIYRKQMKDKKNAAVVSTELNKIGAPVLASLDVKDAQLVQNHQPGANGANHGHQAVGGGPGAGHRGGVARQAAGPEIIPVHAGDPRVPAAFAALGAENMYQIGNLILSAKVGPHEVQGRNLLGIEQQDGEMSQRDAEAFCRNLGPGVHLLTREEYGVVARAMTFNGQYDRNRIPDMSDNWFWSSSVDPQDPGFAIVFNGDNGRTDYDDRRYEESVRCGLLAAG